MTNVQPINHMTVLKYTAITFAPVQGFIEKSRKLRDLYGASLILSHLSQKIVEAARQDPNREVISPGLPTIEKGMPNRILVKGELSEKDVRETLLSAWKTVLQECRSWIETKLPHYQYHWEREWTNWGNHAWEIFWGTGDSIQAAMEDLETRKLSRAWTAVNWIGESSSLTGTDAMAFPGLGADTRNPNNRNWTVEKKDIQTFYNQLSCLLENLPLNAEPKGKFLSPHEKLSILELVKRLVTYEKITKKLGITPLEDGFSDIYRKPEMNHQQGEGRWTGWFMGDGDKVGDYLKTLADEGDGAIKEFSEAMRHWGEQFSYEFPESLGRVVYAGGDDFLGVIYSDKDREPILLSDAMTWLMKFPKKWEEHGRKITVSVGFVWAGHSVPQRDILQHCREAEKVAKSLGRDRVTIRIVFNSGQYVQWTCPWNELQILSKYQDREGQKNWSHIYNDLAQLQARRAFLGDKKIVNEKLAAEFFDIYFPGEGKKLLDCKTAQHLVGFSEDDDGDERAKATIDWMSDLIHVGWHLCLNT